MKKRTFAMLLCLAMVFALLPSAVLAGQAPLTLRLTTPFGYVKRGGSGSATFTITNNTNADIDLKEAAVTGDHVDSLPSPDGSGTLAAGGTASIQLVAPPTVGVGDYTMTLVWGSDTDEVTASDTLKVREDNTFTASPASVTFAEQYEGYATAPAAETVTVKNTSFEEENFDISIDNTEFEVSPASLTLDPDAEGTFTVRPKTGLAAGTHTAAITISNGFTANNKQVSASFTVHAPNTFTASPNRLLFAAQYEGYASAPVAETVTVKNTGTKAETYGIANSNVTAFEVSPASLTLDPNAEGTFTVRPKTGLAAGTHAAAITISNGVAANNKQVSVSFSVHAPNTFTASPDSLLFAEQYEGYLSAPAAETVTVKNTGTKAETYGIANSNVTAFEVSPASLTLDPNAEGTFTVRPKAGLTAGTHAATITVSNPYASAAQVIQVSFTAIPPIIEYEITQGQNGKAVKNSTDGLGFTANGELDVFTDVFVDGEKLSDQHYTTRSGSTIVTLKASYLATLSVGRHTLRVSFTDGYAETNFTILAEIAEAPVPETGDHAAPIVWLSMMLLAGSLLTATMVLRRKRQNG